jgi:cell wall-associated NlpC family hydrolase
MDKESVKKRAKLVELKNKLLRGEHIQNRQLSTWLGAGVIKEIKDDWESQKSLRADLSSPPEEITEYKKRLQKINFTYARAERYSHQKRTSTAEKMHHDSEAAAEKLIEYLHGILQTDQSLEIWFDRLPDENNRGLTPASLPQVINSRSRFNQGGGFSSAIKSKQEVKIDAVERAISALDDIDSSGPTVSDAAAHSARLRAILKRQQ